MMYSTLQAYLARLADPDRTQSSLWLNAQGQAQARFFNCTLTSVFQPVRDVRTAAITGYEAVARGVGPDDVDLSLWRLLAGAASDDESVELDRLCRMLHAINFFRQDPAPGAELLLSVHDRLLSAVSINHGYAFRRVLDALGLPVSQVILQLPVVTSNQRWLVSYVADNYRRNGFRVALQIDDTAQAHALLAQARPALLRIDAGSIGTDHELTTLLALAQDHGARVLIKQVQSLSTRQQLERAAALGYTLQAQGDAIDAAGNALHAVYGAHSTVAQALTA